ncbi:hypothetical protein ACVW16_005028 [Bradyrhizobium sp. USDA 4474]
MLLPFRSKAATVATFTIAPFDAFNAEAAVFEHRNTLSRLTSRRSFQSSSVMRSRRAGGIDSRTPGAPALLTSKSILSSAVKAFETIRSADAGSPDVPRSGDHFAYLPQFSNGLWAPGIIGKKVEGDDCTALEKHSRSSKSNSTCRACHKCCLSPQVIGNHRLLPFQATARLSRFRVESLRRRALHSRNSAKSRGT